MNIREKIEGRFPGCLSQRRAKNGRQLIVELEEYESDYREYCELLCDDILYASHGVPPFIECKVRKSTPKQLHIEIEPGEKLVLNRVTIDNRGSTTHYRSEFRFCYGKFMKAVHRHLLNEQRLRIGHDRSGADQMLFNWNTYGLSLTDQEIEEAQSEGIDLSLVSKRPLVSLKLNWKIFGF